MKKNKRPAEPRRRLSGGTVLLTAPYLVWMVLFILVPLGVVVFYALIDARTGMFTLENIATVFTGAFPRIFVRSMWYSLAASIICLFIGYPMAYYIARQKASTQRFLYMLVMLPMCMSFLLRTLAWVGLLRDTGIINNLLEMVGLSRVKLIRTPGAVILGMVYNYLPYMVMPLYTTIMKIDPLLVEAAEDLGCSSANVFARVILPLSVPGIISGLTMVFVPAVSTFYISNKLGSAGTVMIGDIIESQFKSAQNPNLGAALSLFMMVMIFICVSLMNRFSGQDEDGGVTV